MSLQEAKAEVDRRAPARTLAARVLILTPTGNDAPLAQQILAERGSASTIVRDMQLLANGLREGAGAVVIASESLADDAGVTELREVVDGQEAWSELPILLFGGSIEEDAGREALELLGRRVQIVVLERPLGVATFVSATEAALRSRSRQYEVRRLLHALEESSLAIVRAHEEANRAKDDFLATLAHELRSPMTAIRGWIQMLKMPGTTDEDAATALAMIESSTKVQANIIEDLMDMSRIIAGKVMIEPVELDLLPVVEKIAATFRPAAVQQGITLEVRLPAQPVVVAADEARLTQVGWNLVSNALKFTPRGGFAAVSLSVNDAQALIRVSDTGEGIAPDLLPYVFDRYRQGESGTKRKSHGGLGLGLAIVRHLVESHGGQISASSEGEGKGATFEVSLPLLQR